jgi:Tfp pilus assembly protein FimT
MKKGFTLKHFVNEGFTLIEAIITLGVITLVFGMTFTSTYKSNEQKKITESAETVRQYYMQAKTLALAGKKDCQSCGAASGVCGTGDAALKGWRVIVTATNFQMYGECGAGTTFFSTGVKTLPANVTLNISGNSNIIFYPLNKGTNLNSTTTITVTSSTTGMTNKSFTVNPQGEISKIN